MSGVMKEVQKIEGKYKKLDAELRKNELYAWEKENTEDIQFLIDAFKQQQEQIQSYEGALKQIKQLTSIAKEEHVAQFIKYKIHEISDVVENALTKPKTDTK